MTNNEIEQKYQIIYIGDIPSKEYYLVTLTNENINYAIKDFCQYFICDHIDKNLKIGKQIFITIWDVHTTKRYGEFATHDWLITKINRKLEYLNNMKTTIQQNL